MFSSIFATLIESDRLGLDGSEKTLLVIHENKSKNATNNLTPCVSSVFFALSDGVLHFACCVAL